MEDFTLKNDRTKLKEALRSLKCGKACVCVLILQLMCLCVLINVSPRFTVLNKVRGRGNTVDAAVKCVS